VADLILSNKINPKFARAKSSINSVNGYVSLTFKKITLFAKDKWHLSGKNGWKYKWKILKTNVFFGKRHVAIP